MGVYIGIIVFMLWIAGLNTRLNLKDKYALFAFAVVLIATAGLRYQVGTDYYTYTINYEQYKMGSLLDAQQVGVRLVARIAALIYDDYATWFFIMSLFSIGFILKAIDKYSFAPVLSVFFFIFLGGWHGSFNLVKQYGAVAILIMGQGALIERKFVKWCWVCLLASLFHISALMMIPIYFLTVRKVDAKHIAVLLIAGLIITVSYDRLFSLMDFLKEGESAVTITSAVGSRTVNALRVAVACAPVLLLIIYRKNYDFENPSAKVWANFSILNAVLYVAVRNSVYLARFCVYTDIFNVFLLPALLNYIPRKRDRTLVVAICMLLYCCFWLYDLSKGSSTAEFHWIFERGGF